MPYEEFLFMIFIQRAGGSVSEAGQKKTDQCVCRTSKKLHDTKAPESGFRRLNTNSP